MEREDPADDLTKAPAQRTWRSGLAILASRDVALFMLSRFLWVSGTQACNVAVAWLVYEITRSPLALGLVGLAAFAPKLAVALIAGVVADRYERRLVMALCLAIVAAANVALVLLVLSAEEVDVNIIYAIVVLVGLATGFVAPTSQAQIASLVPREELSRTAGLSSSISQVAAIIGPSLGGLLFLFGTWAPFAWAAVALSIATLANLVMRHLVRQRSRGRVSLSELFAGLVFIRHRPVILGAISLDLLCVLFGGAIALLPILATEVLQVGASGMGVMRAMPALGAMMVAITLALRPLRRRAGRMLFAATIIFGLATIVLGLSGNFIVSLTALWVIGAADVISVVIRQTLVQADTPDEMRGRVAAVNALFVGASNELGEFESGVAAALFGLVPAIVVGGAATIAIAATWMRLFPTLRDRDWLVEPELDRSAPVS
ncbi:MAG: MFS transporter [Hyphomicrobiales bacterium]|nr:MAG: MFS transporter [Hyphomicrobiales bacterium]